MSTKLARTNTSLPSTPGACAAYEDDGFLVADELGRHCHPDFVSERFETLVRQSDLGRIRLHDTRHTAASIMVANGVPVKVVLAFLGRAGEI